MESSNVYFDAREMTGDNIHVRFDSIETDQLQIINKRNNNLMNNGIRSSSGVTPSKGSSCIEEYDNMQ